MGSLFKKQAGVLCLVDGRVVLVSADQGDTWRIPLGTPSDTIEGLAKQAEDAAWQEAGALGHAQTNRIGEYLYSDQGKMFQVSVFLLKANKFRESWPQSGEVQRRRLKFSEAAGQVDEFGLRDILEKLARRKG